jgi:hypothetical protein
MNWNKWIRQTRRWASMAFTLAVIVNIVAVVQGKYKSGWASYRCSRRSVGMTDLRRSEIPT